MSKLKGHRLDSEVERCRVECSFKRVQELLPLVAAKGSGIEFMSNFLHGETLLEIFFETFHTFPKPDPNYEDSLLKAKKFLLAVFASSTVPPHLALEAHLLLGKLYYICAQFDDALTAINKAKLEQDNVEFRSLRTHRLVAESYAIKGLCLESMPPKSTSKYQKTTRDEQILACFEKSTDLALNYLRELDKFVFSTAPTVAGVSPATAQAVAAASSATVSISATTGAVAPVMVGHHEQVGPFIDTAIQRVPINYIKRKELQKGVDAYRRVLTAIDKAPSQNLQQILSRQLAEVLTRGVSTKAYKAPSPSLVDNSSARTQPIVNLQQQNGGNESSSPHVHFYVSNAENSTSSAENNNSPFCPRNKLEEAYTLLSVSEAIACKEAVLSRAEEHADARQRSSENVKAVQNLLTLLLSSLREYQLISEMYERAMKFAYEDRYIWFQFALSLICQSKYTRASAVLRECVSLADDASSDNDDATQYLICAKMCVEQLGRYDEGVQLARTALKICRGGWLSTRAHLLLGLAYSLKAQASPLYVERKLLMMESARALDDATKCDPKDHLAEFFYALQLAINRNVDEAKIRCQKSLNMRAEQPVALMLMGLLLTAENHYADALNLVELALEEHPSHYGLLVLRMKLEMKLQKTEGALLTAKELLLFWRFPSFSSSPDRFKSTIPSTAVNVDTLSTFADQKLELSAPSVSAAPNASTTNLSTMANGSGGIDVTDKDSLFSAARPMTEYGGAVSTISDSLGLTCNSVGRSALQQFRMQANIWLELAELFLDVEFVDYVQQCVEEACAIFPNSHQALYLKGRLHQRAGRTSEAKACFLGALGIFPSHIASLRCLASVYETCGNLRMAEQVLRELVKIDPLDHTIWFALGNLLSKNGSYGESCECLKTAMLLEETSPLMPFSVIPRITHL